MTTRSNRQQTAFVDFPGLFDQEKCVQRGALSLRSAAAELEALHAQHVHPRTWAEQATALSDTTDIVESTARALRKLCGWLEAAGRASSAGLLDVAVDASGRPLVGPGSAESEPLDPRDPQLCNLPRGPGEVES